MNLNKCVFAGRLGNNPELKYTDNGTACLTFSLGVNQRRKEKNTVTWVNLVMWGDMAENAQPHLHKGKALYVETTYQKRTFDGNNGKVTMHEFVVNSWQFTEKKENGNVSKPETNDETREAGDEDLDDLPQF